MQAIELLFQLPASHSSEWPGILAFCSHLEKSFEELLDPRFRVIWKILGRAAPSSAVDCWEWCFVVIKAFQDLEYEDPSMEKAYRRILENSKNLGLEVESNDKLQIMQAIFAVLCWTSATLKPILHSERPSTTSSADNSSLKQDSSLVAENSSQKYSYNDLRRPISKMFYHFRPHNWDVEEPEESLANRRNQSDGGISNDVLYQSSLNYFSLSIIGHVKVIWVDTLTSHLAFDRSTRTLSIFRFPSFCATHVLSKSNVEVLQK